MIHRLSTGNDHLFAERTEGYAYNCLVCCETCDERDMIGCAPIGHNRTDLQTHFLCQECVRGASSALMVDGKLAENGTGLKCVEVGCKRVLLWASVKRVLLDKNTAEHLDKRITKDALRDIEGIEYCKEEDCSYGVFIEQNPSQMQFFSCQNPACMSQFCRICKISFAEHVGKTCLMLIHNADPQRRIDHENNLRLDGGFRPEQGLLADPTADDDNPMILTGKLNIFVEGTDEHSIRDQMELWQKNRNNIYRNLSLPKGRCLIINNHTFATMSPRKGTEIDCENVEKLFWQLGYFVTVHNDLTAKEMENTFYKFARDENHGDSTVVVVLTHGRNQSLIGTDGNNVDINYALSLFNSNNAHKSLIGKPKLFFFQACRGSLRDCGVLIDEIEHTDGSNTFPDRFPSQEDYAIKPQAHRIPCESDFFIAYATVSEYVSWRDKRYGSWFIQSICEIFSRHAKESDINELMVLVARRIADGKQTTLKLRKQMPEFSSRLRKKFYFFPGVNQP